MNKIQALRDKSIYKNYFDFLNYRIDEYWLDEKLDALNPSLQINGLVPTLLYWLEAERERKVVWDRILPAESETTVCPVLMCPDDCDFSCSLVVVEILNQKGIIYWKRFGIDNTFITSADEAGTNVSWLKNQLELKFIKAEYLMMLEAFRYWVNYTD
jgi:hypothetical protein